MARNNLWTHGVATQIEFSDRVHDGGPGYPDSGRPRRCAEGTIVRQEADTSNWFHFTVPTLKVYDNDESIYLEYVYIQVALNENAHITKVHLWDGNEPIDTISWNDLDLRGPLVDRPFKKKHRVHSGICISLKVEFLTYEVGGPMGEVCFIGAGAMFSEYG